MVELLLLSPCLPVVGTIDVAALLEAEGPGYEDGEIGTEEPVSLLPSPPAVGTIDVVITVGVHKLEHMYLCQLPHLWHMVHALK